MERSVSLLLLQLDEVDAAVLGPLSLRAALLGLGRTLGESLEADGVGGAAEEGGVQVTAVYHSHVGAGAYLSELDLRHAQDDLFLFPSADWIVLAVVENRVSEVGLFRRASDGFRGHPVESVLS